MSQDQSSTDVGESKKRGYGKVFNKFADMTSMSGVGYIKNTKLMVAKIAWSILLLLALAALSVHLWFSLSQFYSYPKTAKIELGFANIRLPDITICNVNPVSKRRLNASKSESVETLKRLVLALEPQMLAPEQFNDSLSYEDIADLYSSNSTYDYYGGFWDDYDSTHFYDNYDTGGYYDFYGNYYGDYYNWEPSSYDYPWGSDDPGSGDFSGGSDDPGSNDYPGNGDFSGGSDDPGSNDYTGNGDFSGGSDDPGSTDYPESGDFSGGSDDPGSNDYLGSGDFSGGSDYPESNDYPGSGDYTEGSGSSENTGNGDNTGDGSAYGSNDYSGSSDYTGNDGSGDSSTGSGVKKRRKRYAELFDTFNISEFDPTFDSWFREDSSYSDANNAYGAKVDTTTKIDALFRKTFMALPRWERSRLGHNITKMLLKCKFSGRICDENKKLFRLHQTAEYGNCWTLSSPKFLSQDAGPNGGLSVVLNLQSTDYLQGITHGYGARIQIHNRGDYPDPYQDGISIAASMETNVGLKLVTYERLSGNYGDCEDGLEFKKKYKRPYTRRTCQIFCRASLVIERCGCFDELSEEVASVTNQGKNMSSCDTVPEYNCVNEILNALQDKTIVCDCPNPCKESTYVKSISSHQWPTDDHAKLLLAGICAVDTEACKTFLNKNNTISSVTNNFLRLNIFFEDLNFERIKEEPDIGIAQILSDVGGAVGLWIGLSVISFCEVIQLLFELAQMTRHKMLSQRRERQNSKKRKSSERKSGSGSTPEGTKSSSVSGNDAGNVFTTSNRPFSFVNNGYKPSNGIPWNYNGILDKSTSRNIGHLDGLGQQSKRSRF